MHGAKENMLYSDRHKGGYRRIKNTGGGGAHCAFIALLQRVKVRDGDVYGAMGEPSEEEIQQLRLDTAGAIYDPNMHDFHQKLDWGDDAPREIFEKVQYSTDRIKGGMMWVKVMSTTGYGDDITIHVAARLKNLHDIRVVEGDKDGNLMNVRDTSGEPFEGGDHVIYYDPRQKHFEAMYKVTKCRGFLLNIEVVHGCIKYVSLHQHIFLM